MIELDDDAKRVWCNGNWVVRASDPNVPLICAVSAYLYVAYRHALEEGGYDYALHMFNHNMKNAEEMGWE